MTDLRRARRRKPLANYGIYEEPDPKDLETYERMARSPEKWFAVAKDLKLSAETLWRQLRRRVFGAHGELSPAASRMLGLGPVFLMLAGLSIENAAKALVVGKFPILTERGRLRFITGHGIRRFLSTARFNVNSHEHEFLVRLEMYVVWAGRYPVAKDIGRMEFSKLIRETDGESFQRLFGRLEDRITQVLENAPRL